MPFLAVLLLLSYFIVRMLWWFLILAGSAAVVLWAATALYLRVRRHLKASHDAVQGTLEEVELERERGAKQP